MKPEFSPPALKFRDFRCFHMFSLSLNNAFITRKQSIACSFVPQSRNRLHNFFKVMIDVRIRSSIDQYFEKVMGPFYERRREGAMYPDERLLLSCVYRD